MVNFLQNFKNCINPRDGGAIATMINEKTYEKISIPAMGGNSQRKLSHRNADCINPRDGGQ